MAIGLNNLAVLLRTTKRLAEAEPLMCRALAIGAASCGPDHPNVANRLNNLALLLQTTNRLAEAEPLMRRAIAIFETSLGPDHPDTLTARNNLAGKSPSRSTMSQRNCHRSGRTSRASPIADSPRASARRESQPKRKR